VKLQILPNKAGSDYINANHISGGHRNFISTQAPLPGTTEDFWRMLYEQQSSVVVMLTKLIEKNVPKADTYWPEYIGATTQCDYLTVTLIECISPFPSLVLRKFHIGRTGTSEQRPIFHLMYTGWPDSGVPPNAGELLYLIETTENSYLLAQRLGSSGPIVVHCSAGIGRTGTFIGVYQILWKLSLGERASVLETVHNLRKQRSGMVQTVAQYIFIYTTIQSYIARRGPAAIPQHLNTASQNYRSSLLAVEPIRVN